jgi:hypothetical protein
MLIAMKPLVFVCLGSAALGILIGGCIIRPVGVNAQSNDLYVQRAVVERNALSNVFLHGSQVVGFSCITIGAGDGLVRCFIASK